MNGVVSLLDDERYHLIENLWEELRERFGVRVAFNTPFPHFTHQVSEEYDLAAVETALKQIAENFAPFKVRTGGLGIFTGAHPVLYIPIVRNAQLNELHEAIWRTIEKEPTGDAARYYDAQMWLPHITLAQGEIDGTRLIQVVRELWSRNFHWEMEVNNLSLIYDTGAEQGLRCRFNFKNGRRRTR